MRFGRLRLSNATGSELLALPVLLSAQYWNGQGFVTNTLDSCTSLAAPSLTFYLQSANNHLASGETVASIGSTLAAGLGSLSLSAPGAGNFGYLDLTLTAPTWLQYNWDGVDQLSDGNLFDDNPRARAAFGKRKGADKVIIRREIY
jgi:MSHA biogenesis protein MshQ